jgi:hypothetical protein
MQSTGSAFPIVERQSQIVAEYLAGAWAKPPPHVMRADIERRYRWAHNRWGPHGRPRMRVDFDLFMNELAQEIEAGRARTQAAAA